MTVIRRLNADTAPLMRIIVEPVLVGDVTLLRIGRNSLSMGYLPAKPAAMVAFPPDESIDYAQAISDPNQAVFAAFEDEQCIGTALVQPDVSGWAHVRDIRVAATACRKGIARSLLDACEAFAVKQGCEGLHLAVSDNNPGACQFAEKCGFTLQGFDKAALAQSRTERGKPLAARAVLLHFYRNRKG